MLYREIIAVCSQIHTKHINTLCGQNVELYIKIQSVPRSKHTVSVTAFPRLLGPSLFPPSFLNYINNEIKVVALRQTDPGFDSR